MRYPESVEPSLDSGIPYPITIIALRSRLKPGLDWFAHPSIDYGKWLAFLFELGNRVATAAGGQLVGFARERLQIGLPPPVDGVGVAVELRAALEAARSERFDSIQYGLAVHQDTVLMVGDPARPGEPLAVGPAMAIADRVADSNFKHRTTLLVSSALFGNAPGPEFEAVDGLPVPGTSELLATYAFAGDRNG